MTAPNPASGPMANSGLLLNRFHFSLLDSNLAGVANHSVTTTERTVVWTPNPLQPAKPGLYTQ